MRVFGGSPARRYVAVMQGWALVLRHPRSSLQH
jgi:hypothetical protein